MQCLHFLATSITLSAHRVRRVRGRTDHQRLPLCLLAAVRSCCRRHCSDTAVRLTSWSRRVSYGRVAGGWRIRLLASTWANHMSGPKGRKLHVNHRDSYWSRRCENYRTIDGHGCRGERRLLRCGRVVVSDCITYHL